MKKISINNILIEYADGSIEAGSYGYTTAGISGKYVNNTTGEKFEFNGDKVIYSTSGEKRYEGTYMVTDDYWGDGEILFSFNDNTVAYQGSCSFDRSRGVISSVININDNKYVCH